MGRLKTKKSIFTIVFVGILALLIACGGGYALFSKPIDTAAPNTMQTANGTEVNQNDYVGRVPSNYAPTTNGKAISTEAELRDWITSGQSQDAYLLNDITDLDWTSSANDVVGLAPSGSDIRYTLDGRGHKISLASPAVTQETTNGNSSEYISSIGSYFGGDALGFAPFWYSGYKDTANKVINGVTMGSRVYGGLTSVLSGTIKNLVFEINRNYVLQDGTSGSAAYMGGLVGYAKQNSKIENVHVKFNNSRFGVGKSHHTRGDKWVMIAVGGLAGMFDGKVYTAQVTLNNSTLEATSYYWYDFNSELYCGGMIGRFYKNGDMQNLIMAGEGTTAKVKAQAKAANGGGEQWARVGGFVGLNEKPTADANKINNITFKGTIQKDVSSDEGKTSSDGFAACGNATAYADSGVGGCLAKDGSGSLFGITLNDAYAMTPNDNVSYYWYSFNSNGTNIETNATEMVAVTSSDRIVWHAFNSERADQTTNVFKVNLGSNWGTLDPAGSTYKVPESGTAIKGEAKFAGANGVAIQEANAEYKQGNFDLKVYQNGRAVWDANDLVVQTDRTSANQTLTLRNSGNYDASKDQTSTYFYKNTDNRKIGMWKDLDTSATLTIDPRTITVTKTNVADNMTVYNSASVQFTNQFAGDYIKVNKNGVESIMNSGITYNSFTTMGTYTFSVPNSNYKFDNNTTSVVVNVAAHNVTLSDGLQFKQDDDYTGGTTKTFEEANVEKIVVGKKWAEYGVRYNGINLNGSTATADVTAENTYVEAEITMDGTVGTIGLGEKTYKKCIVNVVIGDGAPTVNEVNFGDKLNLTANEKLDGKVFVKWTINEQIVSYMNEFGFRPVEDEVTIKANYVAEQAYTHKFFDMNKDECFIITSDSDTLQEGVVPQAANQLGWNFHKWEVKAVNGNVIEYQAVYLYNDEAHVNVTLNINGEKQTITEYNKAIELEADTYYINGVQVDYTEKTTIYAISDMTIETTRTIEEANQYVESQVDKKNVLDVDYAYISATVVSTTTLDVNNFAILFEQFAIPADKVVKNGNVYQFCVRLAKTDIETFLGTGTINYSIAVYDETTKRYTTIGGQFTL